MSMLLAGSITIAFISLVVALPHIFTATQISYGMMAVLAGAMFYFIYQLVKPVFEVEVVEEVQEVVVEEVPTMKAEPMPKRKRRTKAEMQQAAEAPAPKKRGPKSKK